MDEAFRISLTPRDKNGTVRAAAVAGQQWGVIGVEQLRDCGVSPSTAARWRRTGRLHLIHPGVFALGRVAVPVEGRMVAALLHAGASALLSHATAAWWWGLNDVEPTVIHLSSRVHRAGSREGVVIHRRRRLEGTRHRRFPITTIRQTLVDFAAVASFEAVRRALAEADYRGLLDVSAVAAFAGRGKPGTATLRAALKRHLPRLAYTRSRFELAFLALCEQAGIPLPEINVRLAGWTADAVWLRERVVVELDGYDNHRSRAQIERDRRKELDLRTAGYVVRATHGRR